MTGFAKYRRSPFATMIGVVLLVAVVFWLLAHPAGSGTQDADFAALAADPGYAAEVRATGARFEHRAIDPLADLVRLHRTALDRAVARGLDPDQPRNLTRSVILDA